MKHLFLILILVKSITCNSQNLVIDGSFEDTLHCPDINNPYADYNLKYWNNSIGIIYNNFCNTNYYSVPQNYAGFQNSSNGSGYVLIMTYCNVYIPEDRRYLIGKLNQLVIGKKYKFSLNISLADSFNIACNNLSVYFSDTVPSYNYIGNVIHMNLTHPPEINFHTDLSNKNSWKKLDTIFVATGNEKWLTIGNFLNNADSDTSYVGGNSSTTNYPDGTILYWDIASYYIDDVSVELYDDTGLEEDGNAFGITILPNPNNGCFTIKADTFNKPTAFVITDALRQVIDIVTFTGSSTKYDNRNLPNGIYFYTTLSNNVVTSRGKFLLQK